MSAITILQQVDRRDRTPCICYNKPYLRQHNELTVMFSQLTHCNSALKPF
jgi:hypothetical protein